MNGVLGQFGTGGTGGMGGQGGEQQMATPATSPLVNPASMQPQAMGNMMGSPLSNGGANMMPYLSMQEQFAPKPLQSSASAGNDAGYAGGGLVSFASGGMPPMQDPMAGGAPPAQGMPPGGGLPQPGAPGMEGEGGEGELDPRIMQEVERIFTENIDNPQAISDQLLQFVMQEIQAAVSPEQMEEIQSPEGQAMLKQELEKMMAQMQGGLGGQGGEGGMPPEGGAPPPPGGAPPGGGGGLAGMMG